MSFDMIGSEFLRDEVEGRLSVHARQRLSQRSVSIAAVSAALEHGRVVHVRGAVVYALGRREVARARLEGRDLAHYEGTQVVTAASGEIMTVYRNRSFRGLRHEGFRRPRRWRVAG